MKKLKKHRFNVLPPANEHDMKLILDGMKFEGYDEHFPVILYEGDILDGWHRYEAALKLDLTPNTQEFIGSHDDALRYVKRTARRRNHTPSQLAAIVVEMLPFFSEQARERKVSKLNQNQRKSLEINKGSPLAPIGANGKAAKEAAKGMDVSQRSIERAGQVKKADPEKFEEVKSGTKTVHAAATEIKKEAAKKEAVLDDTGYPVPKPARAVWDRKEEAEGWARVISKSRVAIKSLKYDGDPLFAEVNVNSVISHLDAAYREFKQVIPYCVCPYCGGQIPEKCNFCKGRGVISKYRYAMVPEELRVIRDTK